MYSQQVLIHDWTQEVLHKASLDQRLIIHEDVGKVALHMIEEAMEVCLALGIDDLKVMEFASLAWARQRMKLQEEGPKEDVYQELADLNIINMRVCNIMDYDLERITMERHQYNVNSNWDVKEGGDFRRIKK